jgi:hypothetical protein
MNLRRFIVRAMFPVLLASGAYGQGAPQRDRDLEVLEVRLQGQRAEALGARLALYSDDLLKLSAQLEAAGDAGSAAAVQAELKAIRLAMNRLAAISRGEAEPPSAEELKAGGAQDAAALAARRINAIAARFNRSKPGDPSPAGRVAAAPPPRRVLRFDRAALNSDLTGSNGSHYWASPASYAAWSLANMAPGEYEVMLRCTADHDSGGKAVVKAGNQILEVIVPGAKKGQVQRELSLNAGILKLTEPGVDIRVENGGLAPGAKHLWNPEAVVLQPVNKRP